MSSYVIEIFGNYGSKDIESIVDTRTGDHWFTQQTVAEALGLSDSALSHMRKNHPGEFSEGIEYTTLVHDGKRRIAYSSDGFFLVCDMSNSEEAFRLRRWMRKQFKVKRDERNLIIEQEKKIRALPEDDMSDLPMPLQMMHQMFTQVAQNYRQVEWLKMQRELMDVQIHQLEQKKDELIETTKQHEELITEIQDAIALKPGEVTASQLAFTLGWLTKSKNPHNGAIILAAACAGYIDNGQMIQRKADGPMAHREILEYVLTPQGVIDFTKNIDSKYTSGQSFTITPNTTSKKHGMTKNRHVYKK